MERLSPRKQELKSVDGAYESSGSVGIPSATWLKFDVEWAQNKLSDESKLDSALRIIVRDSTNEAMRLSVTQRTRLLLSTGPVDHACIDKVSNAGLVPYLVEGLLEGSPEEIQLESAWALTNIAIGSHGQVEQLVSAGSLPRLMSIVSNPIASQRLREQAVWALGNIIGDSVELRDKCLERGFVPKLVAFVESCKQLSSTRTAVWCMKTCCKHKPKLEYVAGIAQVAAAMLSHSDDSIVRDACRCLAFLSDGSDDRIEAVVSTGAVPRLVKLARTGIDPDITHIAVEALGNIVSGTDAQTQTVLDAGGLSRLRQLLERLIDEPETRETTRLVTWAICNICGGNDVQRAAVMGSGVLPLMIKQLDSYYVEIREDVAWALSNFCHTKNLRHIAYVVAQSGLKALCNCLHRQTYPKEFCDSVYLGKIVVAIGLILNAGARVRASKPRQYPRNPYTDLVNEYDYQTRECLVMIRDANPSGVVHGLADRILKEHFRESRSSQKSQVESILPEGAHWVAAVERSDDDESDNDGDDCDDDNEEEEDDDDDDPEYQLSSVLESIFQRRESGTQGLEAHPNYESPVVSDEEYQGFIVTKNPEGGPSKTGVAHTVEDGYVLVN